MKRILRYAAKAPKIACGVAILLVGLGALFLWSIKRGLQRGSSGPPAVASNVSQFRPADVVLCGNSLVDAGSGSIIARNWLEGFENTSPTIAKVDEANGLVVVTGGRGAAQAFGFDGKPIPQPIHEGKAIGPAAFDMEFRQVAFVKASDLWTGILDWKGSAILDARKVTDTAYFRPENLASPYLWHGDALLVSVLGKTLEVKLGSGEVREVPVSVGELFRNLSPDGTFAVMQSGPKVWVVDLTTEQHQEFNVGKVAGGPLWLTGDRAVFRVGRNQLAQYDHQLKQVLGPQECQSIIRDIVLPSPDGSSFLVATDRAIVVMDLEEKRDSTLQLQFTTLDWISNDQLLCSCDAVETDKRGLWLVGKTGEMVMVLNYPVDPAVGRAGAASLMRCEGGALFVSRGDLWRFESETRQVRQLTHDGGLIADLKALKP